MKKTMRQIRAFGGIRGAERRASGGIAQADLRAMSSLYYAPYGLQASTSRVTPSTALALSSVWAACNRISADLASMELSLYRRRDDGGRQIVPEAEHPTSKALRVTPDGIRSSFHWKQLTSAWVLGWGNGESEIVWNGKGQCTGLNAIHPSRVRIEYETGTIQYLVDNGKVTLKPEACLHQYGFSTDGIAGISPIRANAMSVALGLQSTAFSVGWYEKGAVPNGFVKVPGTLNADQQKQLREQFQTAHQGPEQAGKLGILTGGMDWVNAPPISPADQQLIESRRFSISDVARIYSMPLSKLAELTDAHYNNVEEMNLDYLVSTLRSWVECFEATMNFRLLTDVDRARGLFIAYDMASFLRGNLEAQSKYYAMAIQNGWMCINEVRSDLNMAKIDGGDQHFIQKNMMNILDSAGGDVPDVPMKPGILDPSEPVKPKQSPQKNSQTLATRTKTHKLVGVS